MTSSRVTRKNRAWWDSTSTGYQDAHGDRIEIEALAWGVWRIPESALRVLGDLRGLDVLELGCGGGQWTTALLRDGFRAFGVDFSAAQLGSARERARRLGTATPFSQGDAEQLPFADASFDVVFCDHGATSFARPEAAIAEASRVMRAGGLLAFCMSSPIRDLCWKDADDVVSDRLQRDYFSLYALEDDQAVCHQLAYGAWIRLFRQNELSVEDLVELRAPEDATTSYDDFAPLAWARRWPGENIWKLRKTS